MSARAALSLAVDAFTSVGFLYVGYLIADSFRSGVPLGSMPSLLGMVACIATALWCLEKRLTAAAAAKHRNRPHGR